MKLLVYPYLFTTLFITLFILFYPTFCNSQSNFLYYPDQKHLLLDWKKVAQEDPANNWFNLHYWIKEQKNKVDTPTWKAIEVDRHYSEIVGRVIGCAGSCFNHRDEGENHVTFRSRLLEGDEISTAEDSYLWAYLMDGTLMRLGPKSSLTLQEIIVGEKKIVIEARLNYGLLAWLARLPDLVEESALAETDALFLPLALEGANPEYYAPPIKEGDLAAIIEPDQTHLRHTQKLNEVITKDNEQFAKKKSQALLVFPNGSLLGESLNAMVFTQFAGPSYWKALYPEKTLPTFLFRGSVEQKPVENGSWYMVSENGRELTDFPEGDLLFGREDFFLTRTTSIMMAREWMARAFSWPLFETDISPEYLLTKVGYRLWLEDSDVEKRLNYRIGYTGRQETALLSNVKNLKQEYQEMVQTISRGYDESYNRKALKSYLDSISEGN